MFNKGLRKFRCLDICICMDVESNPGPNNENNASAVWNSGVICTKKYIIKYARRDLFKFRSIAVKPNSVVVDYIKSLKLFRYRGSRAGKRRYNAPNRGQSITVLSRINSRSRRPLRGICRENLINIVRNPLPSKHNSTSEIAIPKFLFTNICSLVKTKNRVRAAVAIESDMNRNDVDICIVSETHLKAEIPDSVVCIPNYNIFRRDRDYSSSDLRPKGGIAIYVRENLNVVDIYKSEQYELICLTLRLPSQHMLFVCGTYHPPKPTYTANDFMQYLINIVDNALEKQPGMAIVIGGDVNQLKISELCLMTGWEALVDFPTRGEAILDNVLTNRPDLFGKCVPYNISIKTDHTAVILPAGTKLKPVRTNVRIRDCRKHRKNHLYRALADESWDDILNSSDVNLAVYNLERTIQMHMDRCMPFKMVCMSSRDPVWMTPLIKLLMREKSRITPKNTDRIGEINWRILEIINHNRRTLLSVPVGSGEWWKNVDYISQRRRKSINVNLDRHLLVELNDYFANLCQDTSYVEPTPVLIGDDVNVPEISEIQVWNNLKHLKKTATGPDLIPYWIWKEHAEIMTPIINKSGTYR